MIIRLTKNKDNNDVKRDQSDDLHDGETIEGSWKSAARATRPSVS